MNVHKHPKLRCHVVIIFFFLTVFSGNAVGEYGLNFPEPITPLGREIFDLHMLTTWITTVLMLIILAVVGYSVIVHRKSRGFQPDQTMHNGRFAKWSWLVVCAMVFVVDLSIAVPASDTLRAIETYEPGEITLKVTGSQWKWTYEYIDDGVSDDQPDNIKFTANIKAKDQAGDLYLRATDRHVVLPTHKRIRILNTAQDVLHAWWVPELGVKKDAIPGYVNETWAILEREGIFRGQCAELCGRGHAFMPIVLEVVGEDAYRDWIKQTKAAQIAGFAKTGWTKVQLMETGQKVFDSNCASCHQTNGEGIPGMFPALRGNALMTQNQALPRHLRTILDGRPGTPMPAWGPQLNDLEIAAVTTYERNAWGNDAGDVVQPAQIEAARADTVASN